MASQSGHLVFRLHIPNLNARVGAADCQADAVRVPGDHLVFSRSNREVGEILTIGGIVDGSNSRIVISDCQPTVVWAEGEGVDSAARLPTPQLLSSVQIKEQDVILLADGDLMTVRAEGDAPPCRTEHGMLVRPAPDPPCLIGGILSEKAPVLAKEGSSQNLFQIVL
jgi:hypothetical protein